MQDHIAIAIVKISDVTARTIEYLIYVSPVCMAIG